MAVAVLGLALLTTMAVHIVQRVDAYLAHPTLVGTEVTSARLVHGSWVVFVWCSDDPQTGYDCPPLSPGDVAITSATTGHELATVPDLSSDHVSPEDMPAIGKLSFTVPSTGVYHLRLTRPLARVFVLPAPGTVGRSLAGSIALGALGLVVMILGVTLAVVRVFWYLRMRRWWRWAGASPSPPFETSAPVGRSRRTTPGHRQAPGRPSDPRATGSSAPPRQLPPPPPAPPPSRAPRQGPPPRPVPPPRGGPGRH